MESKKKKTFVYPRGGYKNCPGHYQRIRTDKQPNKPDGRTNHFPNGRYLEIKTTQQEQQRVIATLDKLKEPTTV